MTALIWIAASITLLLGLSVLGMALTSGFMNPAIIAMLVGTVISFVYMLAGKRSNGKSIYRFLGLVVILPMLWMVHSILGYSYPGNDYVLYAVGSGVPALLFLISKWLVAVVGVVPMVAMGYTLYRSEVALRGFAISGMVTFLIVFFGYIAYDPDGGFARLTPQPVYLWDYYFAAFNFALIAQAPGVVLSLFFRHSRVKSKMVMP